MSNVIDSFSGKYRFLSNFWPCVVTLDGQQYTSTEHAYQAAKTLLTAERYAVFQCKTPSLAKRMGRKVTMREDWDDVKLGVMLDLTRQKYMHPDLRAMLLETGDLELIEGNHWNDVWWGVCRGVGENHLGKILMQVRDECRSPFGRMNIDMTKLTDEDVALFKKEMTNE